MSIKLKNGKELCECKDDEFEYDSCDLCGAEVERCINCKCVKASDCEHYDPSQGRADHLIHVQPEKIDAIIQALEELLFACKAMHERLHGTPDVTGDCRFADAIARAEALKNLG